MMRWRVPPNRITSSGAYRYMASLRPLQVKSNMRPGSHPTWVMADTGKSHSFERPLDYVRGKNYYVALLDLVFQLLANEAQFLLVRRMRAVV